jgi:hypothetical protein
MKEGSNVQFGRFRHKGLKALHDDDNAKGVPGAMAAKGRRRSAKLTDPAQVN